MYNGMLDNLPSVLVLSKGLRGCYTCTIKYALYVHVAVIVAFRSPVNRNAGHVMKSSICIYSCCTV